MACPTTPRYFYLSMSESHQSGLFFKKMLFIGAQGNFPIVFVHIMEAEIPGLLP